MKLSEKQLRNIVKESISNILNEYKTDDYMSDKMYTRPNGENNINKGFNWYSMQPGKRALSNYQDTDPSQGKTKQKSSTVTGPFSHGKGKLCLKTIDAVSDILQVSSISTKPTGKIEWTEEELKLIDNIYSMIRQLAFLSKKEGNKKRGYEPQQ